MHGQEVVRLLFRVRNGSAELLEDKEMNCQNYRGWRVTGGMWKSANRVRWICCGEKVLREQVTQ